ncbi:Hypothetical Protein FCC1311_118192, partial [Hondaea fermentalgiana]
FEAIATASSDGEAHVEAELVETLQLNVSPSTEEEEKERAHELDEGARDDIDWDNADLQDEQDDSFGESIKLPGRGSWSFESFSRRGAAYHGDPATKVMIVTTTTMLKAATA